MDSVRTRSKGLAVLREVLVLGAVYLGFTLVRLALTGSRSTAYANAEHVMSLEHTLHIDLEQPVNSFISPHTALALPLCYGYTSLHEIGAGSVLVWLAVTRPWIYPVARNALIIMTLVALIGIWLFPLAPPRMMPGFTDTLPMYAEYGWWPDTGGGGGATNEFAAMPSLHAGWALFAGWYLIRYGSRWWHRAIGVAYPAYVSTVIVGTANHWVVDIIAGGSVLAVGVLAAGRIASRRTRPEPGPDPVRHPAPADRRPEV